MTGFVRQIFDKKLDFVANHRARRLAMERDALFDHGRALIIQPFCAIVPVIPVDSFPFRKSISPIIGIIVIVTFLTFARLCQFEEKFWITANVINTILGFPIKQTPKRFIERMMFLTLIGTSSIYSVLLWNELMQNAMHIQTEIDFEDIENIIKWPLALMADYDTVPNGGILEFNDADGVVKNISIVPWDTQDNCLNMLINYKNVSCIMGKLRGKITVFRTNLYR